jgi:hypothetical protein
VREPKKFWGPFDRSDDTMLWYSRFTDVQSWADRKMVLKNEGM